ncbi:hypothetical protein BDW22DRAFT_1433273 [Trametopsis cervina]|nr:hypothetical protein BDW22DRAFT_1433273 [Trametopsis cervina]
MMILARQHFLFAVTLCKIGALAVKSPPAVYQDPPSEAVDHVNPLIGNAGNGPGGGSGGHNDHSNEPSHHIPYLYSFAGAASRAQERVRSIAMSNYNSTARGLSGNEDCGQMSAWYIFSALGFYPVNPVSGGYAVGSPFYDKVTISLPGKADPLVISSGNASRAPYVASLKVNGENINVPTIQHGQIANGGEIAFVMSDQPASWASETLMRRSL